MSLITTDDLLNDTERQLLSSDREQMNRLALPLDATADQVKFEFDLQGIGAGAYVSVDLEVMYVWSVDQSNFTATVQRGMTGSDKATHSAGAVCFVNPKFTRYDMFQALNQEIRDLSSPPNGLWQVKDFTLTSFPVRKSYTVPPANTDLLRVLEIRYQPPGPEFRWERLNHYDWALSRHMPATGSGAITSGTMLRIDRPLYPGRVIIVRYAAPFNELATIADDVVTVTGLPPTALDIPSLGAAARLMGVREAKRSFTESAVDTRRAQEVPSGSAAKAASVIQLLLNQRIRTEYMRLVSQWPEMM